jgi:Fic family protein
MKQRVVKSSLGNYDAVDFIEIRGSLEQLFESIIDDIENDLVKTEEDIFILLSKAYYEILRIQPFNDGNELVARLFMNYIAINFDMKFFSVKPKNIHSKEYFDYMFYIKACDSQPVIDFYDREYKQISEYIIKPAYRKHLNKDSLSNLCKPATVLD